MTIRGCMATDHVSADGVPSEHQAQVVHGDVRRGHATDPLRDAADRTRGEQRAKAAARQVHVADSALARQGTGAANDKRHFHRGECAGRHPAVHEIRTPGAGADEGSQK